jgi:hypothetical protein
MLRLTAQSISNVNELHKALQKRDPPRALDYTALSNGSCREILLP